MADAARVEYHERRTKRRFHQASTSLTVEERQWSEWGAPPEIIAAYVTAPPYLEPEAAAHSTRRYYPPRGAVHRFKEKYNISPVSHAVFPTQHMSRDTEYDNDRKTSFDMPFGMVFLMEDC